MPLKRTKRAQGSKISKPKRISTSKAKKLAWAWFSRFIRLRDSEDGKTAKCCTCGKRYPISGLGCLQAGHFVPGRSNSVLYVEDNVSSQCYFCNFRLGGNWVEYERFMIDKYGHDRVQELKELKNKVVHMSAKDHLEIAEAYRKKVEELGGWK